MWQPHLIVVVVWFISTQFAVIERWPRKTLRIHAFTAPHRIHQSCEKTKRKYRCHHFLFVQRYVSNGINESIFKNTSIGSTNDETIPRSIDAEEISDETSNIETVLHDNNTTIRGITLKMALDANGGVACRSEVRPERFTSTESLDMVHRLRSQSDAVLIGVGTALVDNPCLLVRRNITVTEQPLRVIIDPSLRFVIQSSLSQHNHSYQLLTDGYPLIIFHSRNDTKTNPTLCSVVTKLPSSVQLKYVSPIDDMNFSNASRLDVKQIWDHLQKIYNVEHLMVEGGPTTARLFLQSKLIDRCILVHAPIRFSDPIIANITPTVLRSANLTRLGSIPSGQDILECWSRPDLPWPANSARDWP